MIEKGYIPVWRGEASVDEAVPPECLKRAYFMRRALLGKKISLKNPHTNIFHI